MSKKICFSLIMLFGSNIFAETKFAEMKREAIKSVQEKLANDNDKDLKHYQQSLQKACPSMTPEESKNLLALLVFHSSFKTPVEVYVDSKDNVCGFVRGLIDSRSIYHSQFAKCYTKKRLAFLTAEILKNELSIKSFKIEQHVLQQHILEIFNDPDFFSQSNTQVSEYLYQQLAAQIYFKISNEQKDNVCNQEPSLNKSK